MDINPASLRALREAYGWSLTSLAKAVGVSRPHLSNIEGGRRPASPALVRRLADEIGVPVAALTTSRMPSEVA